MIRVILAASVILAACSPFEMDPAPTPENVWYPGDKEVVGKGQGNDPDTGEFYYIMYYMLLTGEVRQFRLPYAEGEACFNAATIKSPLPPECPAPDPSHSVQ